MIDIKAIREAAEAVRNDVFHARHEFTPPPVQQPANEFRPDWDQVKPFLDRIAELEAQQPSCKWPTCQTEQYQQGLAKQVFEELFAQQPRKAVKLSEEEKLDICRKQTNSRYVEYNSDALLRLSDAIEQAVWANLGVSE